LKHLECTITTLTFPPVYSLPFSFCECVIWNVLAAGNKPGYSENHLCLYVTQANAAYLRFGAKRRGQVAACVSGWGVRSGDVAIDAPS